MVWPIGSGDWHRDLTEGALTVVKCTCGEPAEACLDIVHGALERFWSHVQPPATDTFRMLFSTAVAEVAANILEHARPASRQVRLALELSAWLDRVEARFSDDGQSLAPEIAHPGMAADDLSERGRGLKIARMALDELSYENVVGGNWWRLVKRRGSDTETATPTS